MQKKTIAIVLMCALFVVMTSGAAAPAQTGTEVDFTTVLGVIEDDSYINEYFGVGMQLGEGWEFLTEEELAEMMNATLTIIEDEDLAEMMRENMEQSGAVTNMVAKQSLGLQNLNMRLTKLEEKAILEYSEREILELISGTVVEMLETAGYENMQTEIVDVEFAGRKIPAMYITAEFYNIPLFQKELFLLEEDYYATITFTSFLEDTVDEEIAMWYALDAETEE